MAKVRRRPYLVPVPSPEALRAAKALEGVLEPAKGPVTKADAAAASGLSLADAELGLHQLVAEYRGHLRVTEEGELLFLFPHGFSKPWETIGALRRAGRAVGQALLGGLRFVVRAWVAIVLVGYVAIFVALAIALLFARSSGSSSRESREGPGLSIVSGLLRLVFEAFYWTLHPFSPFYGAVSLPGRASADPFAARRPKAEPSAPFYERVDRFFFGPKEAPPDPERHKKAVLAEIRARKGRIGVADVLRVTGLSRAEVDPLLSRLLVDYEGTIEVSDEGGITYHFPNLRKTALEARSRAPRPVWEERERMPPVTGNRAGEDMVIGSLNAFNLLASGWVIALGLTVERALAMARGLPADKLPLPGTPLALGWIPFVFSLLLFALPAVRLLFRGRKARAVARENGRRAVLQAVLEEGKRGGVTEERLAERWRIATGEEPSEAELFREVRKLGGDVDLEGSGEPGQGTRYRFPDLELEAKAVEAEREAASDAEARVGPVVFTSES